MKCGESEGPPHLPSVDTSHGRATSGAEKYAIDEN